jgi:hypothetical protein
MALGAWDSRYGSVARKPFTPFADWTQIDTDTGRRDEAETDRGSELGGVAVRGLVPPITFTTSTTPNVGIPNVSETYGLDNPLS